MESDATLFLPLATQVAAAIVAEAASGSAERAERTLAGAQETFRGCTQGGLWLEVAGLPAVDGHFSEEEEPSMSSSTTDTGEAPVEADEDDANEDESSGDEDEETSAAEAEISLLLPLAWQLLLGCFSAGLAPEGPSTQRIMSHLESWGSAWLAILVAAMERNAVPASAPSPLQAFLEDALTRPTSEQSEALSCIVDPVVAALRVEQGRPADDTYDEDGRRRKRARGASAALMTRPEGRLAKLLEEEEADPLMPPLEAMAFLLPATALNHSCVPNAVLQFCGQPGPSRGDDPHDKLGDVGDGDGGGGACAWGGWSYASLMMLRDADAEEELTVAYVDSSAPFTERTAALQSTYGFVCGCERCHVQSGFALAADRLASAEAALARAASTAAARAAAEAAERAKATFTATWLAPTVDTTGPSPWPEAPPPAPRAVVSTLEAALDTVAGLGLRALNAGLYAEAEESLRHLLASSASSAPGRSSTRRQRDRRADAMLRLGGALQRLHRFDEARAIWLEAAAEFPEHTALRREAQLAQAYYPCATSSGPGSCEQISAQKLGGQNYCESLGREVWMSDAPLLSSAECATIISACEAHAAAMGGWSTRRHTTVPTTDMEVRAVETARGIFNAACERGLFPFLERAYGRTALGATSDRLRVSDAFVVRYDAAAQRSLPTHQDDSHLSLTIALNGTDEYDGGGTSFEDLERSGGAPIRPEKGHVVAFPGALRHGGAAVTRGVRYIIAVFMWVAKVGGHEGREAATRHQIINAAGGNPPNAAGGVGHGRTPRDGRPLSFVADANAALRGYADGAPCCRIARSRDGPNAGLAVYATRRIRAGEAVLVERPFALTVSRPSRRQTCAHCLADVRDLKARRDEWELCCSRCRSQFYCSRSCQQAASRYHQGCECDALRCLEPLLAEDGAVDPEDADTIAQAVRILALRSQGRHVDVGPVGLCGAGAYDPASAASRMVGVASTNVAAASLATIVSLVLRAVPRAARLPAAALADLLERHANNEFGVSRRGGEVVATASFVGLFHLLNHSCWPNVVFDSSGRQPPSVGGGTPLFSLVALQDIAEGDEICHSCTPAAAYHRAPTASIPTPQPPPALPPALASCPHPSPLGSVPPSGCRQRWGRRGTPGAVWLRVRLCTLPGEEEVWRRRRANRARVAATAGSPCLHRGRLWRWGRRAGPESRS